MEQNKILEILKKVPLGTVLYSPAFGKMEFNGIRDTFANKQRISMLTGRKIDMGFLADGKFRENGEIILFPSNLMRDWDKFGWKKGDVLVSDKGDLCIFTEFLDYPYTTFLGKLVLCKETVKNGTFVEETKCWKKSYKTIEKYIEYINTKLEGSNRIVNPETLETEILYKKESDPPEHKFEPFEKVLVRDADKYEWKIDIFEREDLTEDDKFKYICLVSCWNYCIPYKGNEHLLGTTNNPED